MVGGSLMGRQWYDRHEIAAMSNRHAQQVNDLRAVIVELCAALQRMDRNGYQERIITRACQLATISPDRITTFNEERAARLAARKQGDK